MTIGIIGYTGFVGKNLLREISESELFVLFETEDNINFFILLVVN